MPAFAGMTNYDTASQGERECNFLIRPRGEKVREFILVEKSVIVDNPNPVL